MDLDFWITLGLKFKVFKAEYLAVSDFPVCMFAHQNSPMFIVDQPLTR